MSDQHVCICDDCHAKPYAEACKYEAVLRELVELKDGPRGAEYERRKAWTWACAREALGIPPPLGGKPGETTPIRVLIPVGAAAGFSPTGTERDRRARGGAELERLPTESTIEFANRVADHARAAGVTPVVAEEACVCCLGRGGDPSSLKPPDLRTCPLCGERPR